MDADLRFLRQQGAVDMERLSRLSVTLIGAGSIGSVTAFWLAKMGLLDIHVFDADIVEVHNWSNQLYRASDVGIPKAQALMEVMNEFGLELPSIMIDRYTGQQLTEVVISAVDSMASRKAIWKSVRGQGQVKLYLDARMGLETLMVHALNPQSRDGRIRYTQTLHGDAEALQEPCTGRTICYTPLMASAVLCNLVKRYTNQEQMPKQIVLDLATYTAMID